MIEYETLHIMDIWKYAEKEKIIEIIHSLSCSKSIVWVNGNCQTRVIRKFLMCCPEFAKRYIICELPLFVDNIKLNDLIFENLNTLTDLKLLITQNISENNRFDTRFGSKRLIQRLECITQELFVVTIPNCFFDLYFPQGGLLSNRHNIFFESSLTEGGVFPCSDLFIDELVRKWSVQEIIEIICIENLFSIQFLQELEMKRFDDLFARDEKCDIKIVDFIKTHYKEEALFYTRNHPTNRVIKELVKRILLFLHIEPIIEAEQVMGDLSKHQEFIYPSIYNGLDLQFRKKYYSDGISTEHNSLEDEIRKYCSYCYGKWDKPDEAL